MAPMLGIMASAISGNLFAPSGAYDSIATSVVGSGGVASVTFSSIPQTYTHLQVRVFARSGRARVQNGGLIMKINGNYNTYHHTLYGTGAVASSTASAGGSGVTFLQMPGTSAGSGIFGAAVADILDYASTTKNKTARALNGDDTNGAGEARLDSLFIDSTTAITSLSFLSTDITDNIQEFSHFALYGIKGGN